MLEILEIINSYLANNNNFLSLSKVEMEKMWKGEYEDIVFNELFMHYEDAIPYTELITIKGDFCFGTLYYAIVLYKLQIAFSVIL
jgi:hypothetical protein